MKARFGLMLLSKQQGLPEIPKGQRISQNTIVGTSVTLKESALSMNKFELLRQRFGDKIPHDFDPSEEGVKTQLNNGLEDMAKEMLPHVALGLGIKQDALEKRLLGLGVKEIPEVNGRTHTSDDWKTFGIDINLGLMLFTHEMVKLFATRLGVMDDDGNPVETPAIPFENSASTTKRLMKAFWDGNLVEEQGFELMELSETQVLISSGLLRDAECFVVGHEFGHIVIHTSPRKVSELELGMTTVRKALASAPELSETTKNLLAQEWGEEIAADLIGLQLSLVRKDNLSGKILGYSAAQLVFIMQSMLETFYEKTRQESPPIGSHPPAQFRFNCLRSILNATYPPQALELGDSFKQLADALLLEM